MAFANINLICYMLSHIYVLEVLRPISRPTLVLVLNSDVNDLGLGLDLKP